MRTIAKSAMLVAAVHAAALTAPTLAMAQSAQPATTAAAPARPSAPPSVGNDVIDLKGGAVLRGTIVDAIPNSYARIQLATGEIATVPWQDIARITRPSGAPVAGQSPQQQPPPPPPAAAVAPAATVESVWVHIEGADGAQVEQDRTGSGRIWQPVCSAPCDRALPNAYAYRIVGDGIRPSGAFTLQGAANTRETVNVSQGSKGAFVLGIVGTAVGAVTALVGLIVAAVGAAEISYQTESGYSTSDGQGTEDVGWVISAVGAAAVVGGIILIVTNARTHVSQDTAPAPATGGIDPRLFVPAPEWARLRVPGISGHDVLTSSIPPAVTVPLFSAHF